MLPLRLRLLPLMALLPPDAPAKPRRLREWLLVPPPPQDWTNGAGFVAAALLLLLLLLPPRPAALAATVSAALWADASVNDERVAVDGPVVPNAE